MHHDSSRTPHATPARAAPDPVPLSTLRRGQTATFCRADLPAAECELLCAMGMTDSCHLKVCRSGEPCIVQIRATKLGLSNGLTRHILVSPSLSSPSLSGGAAGQP